ncbi:MAG: GNAT family N-acyltransferase [Pseudomonadota bacterium]
MSVPSKKSTALAPASSPAEASFGGAAAAHAPVVASGPGAAKNFCERAGALEVRLAETQADVAACQQLRHAVFVEEMAGLTSGLVGARDVDRFDDHADHLMVVDTAAPGGARVVGTYRLLRQEVAAVRGGFYTAQEFDIDGVIAKAPQGTRFLELGRSCVHKQYRTRPTINMLWRGIGLYVAMHSVDVMFGCASFPGTDPAQHRLPLSFLYHRFLAPEPWRVRALADRHVEMNTMDASAMSEREAFRALPALIRGYVRVGCVFGDGAVIDPELKTVDVLVMSIIADVQDKYYARFSADDRSA